MVSNSKNLGYANANKGSAFQTLASKACGGRKRPGSGRFLAAAGLATTLLSVGFTAAAQTAGAQVSRESSLALTSKAAENIGTANNDAASPITLTFQDALERARRYSPQFQAAVTAAKLAREDRVQARAAMLPSANYTTQYLGTQGNGKIPTGRYVTEDGVHVYRAWGVFHQALSADSLTLASYHHAEAADVLARAQEEIAERGLTVTVTQAYYGLVVAERKYASSQQSRDQAQLSFQTSQKMEQQGQVAHSDVITFQIQSNQQEEAFTEAKLAMANARLNLAVLLFPNFDQNFNVVDDLDTAQPLPPLTEVQRMASENNPQIRAATAILRGANADLSTARNAFLPSLSFDVDYGIEANHFALRSVAAEYPEAGRVPNMGYFLTASLNLPVWDWGTLRSKLRQAEYKNRQAHEDLSFAQRQFLSNLAADYNEAATARTEVSMLRSSADLAAESLRLNTLRYKAGQATVLDVLNAQTTLTQARDAYADGLARARLSLANLQTLTGNF